MGYEITWEPPDGVMKSFYGFVTSDEFKKSSVEVQSNPGFSVLRYSIHDLTEITGFQVTGTLFEQLAAMDIGASLVNPNYWSLVVTTDGRVLAFIDDYVKTTGNQFPPVVLRTMGDARGWIAANLAA